jgi:hypothetical protein
MEWFGVPIWHCAGWNFEFDKVRSVKMALSNQMGILPF